MSFITTLFENLGLSPNAVVIITKAVFLTGMILISLAAYFITKKIILAVIHRIVQKTAAAWDDNLHEKGVFQRLSYLAPALVIYYFSALILPEYPVAVEVIQRLGRAYMIGIAILVIDAFLSTCNDIYEGYEISKTRPIKGYIQVFKIIGYCVGLILIITTIMKTSPVGILSGIGAMSAVLLLVFKDTILGFVASIQLTANNLVHIGDWIEMPKYGADGEVMEINLQTVKVRNWDKTITTIPIYSLISDSFKNWRGMQQSGGRRIKRSIVIDMTSIRFCDQEMLERFKSFDLLRDYLAGKLKEVDEDNARKKGDKHYNVNKRNLTNIGTFRAYLIEYLKQHPKIHNSMTFLVRQLQPGSQGLPVEIYVFSNDQEWARYESIQADIFDHLLAVIPEFNLRVFQQPSGYDIASAAERIKPGK